MVVGGGGGRVRNLHLDDTEIFSSQVDVEMGGGGAGVVTGAHIERTAVNLLIPPNQCLRMARTC